MNRRHFMGSLRRSCDGSEDLLPCLSKDKNQLSLASDW